MITNLDNGLFSAGVPSEDFEYYAAPAQAGRQRQSNWCWAASVQMVLNYHGLYVSQEDIVGRLFGALYDSPANLDRIMVALSGWAYDTRGKISTIHAQPYVMNNTVLINDLVNYWPLIIGFNGFPIGHACVLTAIYYSMTPQQLPYIHKGVIRDPWPGNESRQEYNWDQMLKSMTFLIRVYINRL